MLCYVGNLRALYLGDDGILARVFFVAFFRQAFFPGSNFAEFQKMPAEGVLAKVAIARLYGHFGSRGLLKKFVLYWHFKCILSRRRCPLRQGVFYGLLSAGLSPGRNFAEF